MQELLADILIQAPSPTVWRVLTDFAGFPEWNPFLRNVTGALWPGARLTVRIQPPATRPMTVHATILKLETGRELVWQARFWNIPGLLDGEQHFRIEVHSTEAVHLRQRSIFTGMLTLLPPLSGILARRLHQGMAEMNQAIKDQAERAP